MQSLRRHYISIGWESAPHLFIARGSLNPNHDGIFQLTPLNLPGTHAGVCNRTTIGIEVVGNYDNEPWPESVEETVTAAIAHFLQWRNLPCTVIRGHRDCNSPKTCPGKAISIPDVISKVETMRKRLYIY
jgi:N-acetyl-anhydromuramyl-L-alanine amidase AmpD